MYSLLLSCHSLYATCNLSTQLISLDAQHSSPRRRGPRLQLLFLLLAVLTVEFTLNWNHISGTTGSSGLNGTGQQLPLIIGAATFLRVIYLLAKEALKVGIMFLDSHYQQQHSNPTQVRRGRQVVHVEVATERPEPGINKPLAPLSMDSDTVFKPVPQVTTVSDN